MSVGICVKDTKTKVPSIFSGFNSTKFTSSGPPHAAECFHGGSLRLRSGQSARLCELNPGKIRGTLLYMPIVRVPELLSRIQGLGARRRFALVVAALPNGSTHASEASTARRGGSFEAELAVYATGAPSP